MTKYQITLPNDKAKAYNRISLLVLAINLLAFGLSFFKPHPLAAYIAAMVMMFIISFALFLYISKNVKLQNRVTIVAIGLSAITWLLLGDYILMFLMALVAAVSYFTLQKPIVFFMDEGVAYPSFPKKMYQWPEVNQVMLKNSILTIDLKNNQLMQFTLSEESISGIKEKEFNEFCKAKVSSTDSLTEPSAI